ncbi:hypothetical protein B0H13DRAFT_2310196 [Mycena leptocephala]|nr:hypothetical protein B0H13DRAFT_2310196 [Mycena leptocephala]
MDKHSKRKRDECRRYEESEEDYPVGLRFDFLPEVVRMVTTRAEVITHARVNIDLAEGWEYRFKWAGYDSDEDSWVIDAQFIHMELRFTSSWEPTENVEACQALLRRFWNEIGLDDNDYGHGHVVMASKEWIELERRVFKEDFPPKKKYKREPKHRPDESGRETVTQTMGTSLRSHSDLAIPDLSSGSAYNHRLIHSLPTATIQARNQHRRSGPKFDEGKLLVVASSCRTNLFSFVDP